MKRRVGLSVVVLILGLVLGQAAGSAGPKGATPMQKAIGNLLTWLGTHGGLPNLKPSQEYKLRKALEIEALLPKSKQLRHVLGEWSGDPGSRKHNDALDVLNCPACSVVMEILSEQRSKVIASTALSPEAAALRDAYKGRIWDKWGYGIVLQREQAQALLEQTHSELYVLIARCRRTGERCDVHGKKDYVLAKSNSTVENDLYWLHKQLGEREKARAHLGRAWAIEPDSSAYNYNLGLESFETGLTGQAVGYWERATRSGTPSTRAMKMLAETHANNSGLDRGGACRLAAACADAEQSPTFRAECQRLQVSLCNIAGGR